MGAEDNPRAFRHFGEFFDENGARDAEFLDNVAVVDDFLADVDGRTIEVYGNFDYIYRAHDTGAETARLEQQNLLFSTTGLGAGGRLDVKKCVSGRHRKKA